MDEESLNTAINLVRSGQRLAARSLLARLLREDPSDETAWMWLVETMDNDAHRAEALRQCLSANPGSEAAQTALKRIRIPAGSLAQKGGFTSITGPLMAPLTEPPTSTPTLDSQPKPEDKKPKRPGFVIRLLKGCMVIFAILALLGLLGGGGYFFYQYISSQPTPTSTATPITVVVPTETRATRFVLQPTSTSTLVPSPTSASTATYMPAPNFDPAWKIAWVVKDNGLYSLSSVGIPELEIPGYPYPSYPPPVSRVSVNRQMAWVYPADGGPRRLLVDESTWTSATEGWNAVMGGGIPMPTRSAVVLEAMKSITEGDPRLLGFVVVSDTGGEVLFVLPVEPVQGRAFYSPDGHYAAILTATAISLVDFVTGEIKPNLMVNMGGIKPTDSASNPDGVYWLDDGKSFYVAIPQSRTGSSHHLYRVEAATASAYRLEDLPTTWDMGRIFILQDGSTLVYTDSQGSLFLFNPLDAMQTPLAGIGEVISNAPDGRHFLLWTGKEYWVSQVDGEPYRLGRPGMQLEKPVWLGNLDLVFLVKEDTRYSLYYQGMDNSPQRLVTDLGADLDEIGLFTWPEGEDIPWEAPNTLFTPNPVSSPSGQAVENMPVPGTTSTPGPAPELQPIPGLTLQTVLDSFWKEGFNCIATGDAPVSSSQVYQCVRYGNQEYTIQAEVIHFEGGVTSIHELITPEEPADQGLNESVIPTALDHFSLMASLPFQGADPEAAGKWLENNISSVLKNFSSAEREFSPVKFRLSRSEALVLEMSAIRMNE